MAYNTFSALRDDYQDDSVAAGVWTTYTIGSATVAETGGEARITLPASTAGTHEAGYVSQHPYTLTSDSWYINIDTMVSTAVAATAIFDLRLVAGSAANVLRWRQVSNAITARHIVAGVETQVYTATWSATTYKYLRIRADTTTVYWDSSTNGTSWTNRASVLISALFPVTDLFVVFNASCGNVATPGSFRLEDVNLVLPALTTNWNWTQALEALTERIGPATIAIDTAGTAQGYIVTADGVDVSGNPSGNLRYFSGPAGQGRKLTEQTTQALAQAMAVNLPLDGRFDLPELVECKCIRLYHRSVDGAAYKVTEFYPRRQVEADDIKAETITGLHIAAGTITADKLFSLLVISNTISTDYNGARVTLSGSPNGGFIGYGATDTYDPVAGTGTYQVLWKLTDGKFYAGGGNVVLDSGGVEFFNPNSTYVRFWDDTAMTKKIGEVLAKEVSAEASVAINAYGVGATFKNAGVALVATTVSSASNLTLYFHSIDSTGHSSAFFYDLLGTFDGFTVGGSSAPNAMLDVRGDAIATGGLNVGSATGAATGSIKCSTGISVGTATGGTLGRVDVSSGYSVAGTAVIGTRKTGWTAATGTATRTTFVTSSVTLPVLAEHVKALLDDLLTHGAIGA